MVEGVEQDGSNKLDKDDDDDEQDDGDAKNDEFDYCDDLDDEQEMDTDRTGDDSVKTPTPRGRQSIGHKAKTVTNLFEKSELIVNQIQQKMEMAFQDPAGIA
jgi:hypothetical protein